MEIHWFDYITFIMFFIFIYGILYNVPSIFIQINFTIKVLIAFYLMYKFNDFRDHTFKITLLDKKICFSAGIYLFIFSFADVINSYLIEIKSFVTGPLRPFLG